MKGCVAPDKINCSFVVEFTVNVDPLNVNPDSPCKVFAVPVPVMS